MDVLKRVANLWEIVGDLLYIPTATLAVIRWERVSDVEGLRTVLRYWLQHDPHASWRMLIWRFNWSVEPDLKGVADDISIYAEPLTGQY